MDNRSPYATRCLSALAALGRVVLGIFENRRDEGELGSTGEVADREDRAQRLVKPRNIAGGLVRTQELLIAFALNLDQVRHLNHFVNVTEDLADPLFRRARYLPGRSEEHTSELQSLMRNSYAVFCLKKKNTICMKHATKTHLTARHKVINL